MNLWTLGLHSHRFDVCNRVGGVVQRDSKRSTQLSLYLPYDRSSIFIDALSQSVKSATTAGSHLARLTLHEEHRQILTTVFTLTRTMYETPSFMVAIAVVKLRLGIALRNRSSGSVSVFDLRGSWRSCIDRNPDFVVANEGVDLCDHFAYRQVIWESGAAIEGPRRPT